MRDKEWDTTTLKGSFKLEIGCNFIEKSRTLGFFAKLQSMESKNISFWGKN